MCALSSYGQTPQTSSSPAHTPLAIVPNDGSPSSAIEVRGAIDVIAGKANIESSGTVTAGEHPVAITLPERGGLRLCSASKVSLTRDSSVPAGEKAGLLMALDRGALEANFAIGRNSDLILTPDFRILISGPGVAAVQVRLGAKGDTCVDNRGQDGPYVAVSSVFEDGVYRVQPTQRVMFQHGSLREVVDDEKESCGCPPEEPLSPPDNAFPVAQSTGLSLHPAPTLDPTTTKKPEASAVLVYNGGQPDAHTAAPQAQSESAPITATPPAQPAKPAALKSEKKRGFFGHVGKFFRNLFGG